VLGRAIVASEVVAVPIVAKSERGEVAMSEEAPPDTAATMKVGVALATLAPVTVAEVVCLAKTCPITGSGPWARTDEERRRVALIVIKLLE
jgi:hypothetical protein